MTAETLACILLVLFVSCGWSAVLAGRFGLAAPEALVAGVALSLLGAWILSWSVFALGLPLEGYRVLPLVSAGCFLLGRRGLRLLGRDPCARDLAVGQLLVTSWSVGWLCLIRVHTGGAWTGDWFEHWERAHYFLRQWPSDRTLFIGTYLLPARPPLANVLTAAFLQMTRADYAHYQTVMAVLCSLAFLPVGLLAWRFGGRPAVRSAAAVVMLNPLFLQNSTFPWTKLIAAFFILTGLHFFLSAREGGFRLAPSVLCALILGAAILAHYSAGPYVVVLAAAWLACGVGETPRRRWLVSSLAAIGAGALVLAPWFLWSASRFGWEDTLLSNSSITSLDRVQGSHLMKVLLNLRDTLIPSQVRGFEGRLFVQSSPWGRLRDACFLCYQINLPLALGAFGWVVVAREAVRAGMDASLRERRFWVLLLTGFIVLSIAVYGDREHYGIVHICLQATVLLGLAFLAARWERLSPGWRVLLAAGWFLDLLLGIVLQVSIESLAMDRWMGSTAGPDAAAATYGPVSQANYLEKASAHLQFLGDLPGNRPLLIVGLLAALLLLGVLRLYSPGAGESHPGSLPPNAAD